MPPFKLTVNGSNYRIEADPETPLLYVLRNQLGLNGPRYGCGFQQCGACMVLLDGEAAPTCMLPVTAAEGKNIRTLEGLAAPDGALHPVQQAFLDEQAAQCGYCTNGMIIAAVSLLDQKRNPEEEDIREALHANLCRCGTQSRVLRAVKRVVR